MLETYAEVLADAVNAVRGGLGIAPTSRIKNTTTILEKLRRTGGSSLKNMQDVAGMRIVDSFGRSEQDALAAQVAELFSKEARAPKVIDRRAVPTHGYAAVHVVVFPAGTPVEIQIRTRWQHEWADLFEKPADKVGRGIRYGEAPTHWQTQQHLEAAPPVLRELYEVSYRLRSVVVEHAIAIARLIGLAEAAEQEALEAEEQGPYRDALDSLRRQVDTALVQLRKDLAEL